MTTETLPAVAPEIVSPLKPSEALRLGRLTRPRRISGVLFDERDGACALGAMMTGLGHDEDDKYPFEVLPTLTGPAGDCTIEDCEHRSARVLDAVWHLNDQHDWSDAQIVAWLESLGL